MKWKVEGEVEEGGGWQPKAFRNGWITQNGTGEMFLKWEILNPSTNYILSGGSVQPENTYSCILKVTSQVWKSQKWISINTNHNKSQHWQDEQMLHHLQHCPHLLICYLFLVRMHYRLLTILKTRNKSVWSNVFWYVKVLCSESLFNTLYIEIKYKC